jgi:LPS-assembly protein
LAYNYTPKRNQSALANFDSEKINESYENLFSGKKFTGLDRISKTNNIVIGLESDFSGLHSLCHPLNIWF